MVNNSTKGKIFTIICIVLIAFGCSSALNLVWGDVFTFDELFTYNETAKLNVIGNNEFNPVYLVSHKETYITPKNNNHTNVTNRTKITNKTKVTNKTITNNKKYYNKTKSTNSSILI